MVIVLSIKQWHVGQFLSQTQMPYYSFILSSIFFLLMQLLVPSQLRLKTTNHKDMSVPLLKVLHSCLMSRYRWEGGCLRLIRTLTFKPCHIISQLGSATDNVHGVKAEFKNPLLGLARVMQGGGMIWLVLTQQVLVHTKMQVGCEESVYFHTPYPFPTNMRGWIIYNDREVLNVNNHEDGLRQFDNSGIGKFQNPKITLS